MNFEQKIDLLVEKILLLTGKVEQRSKANEINSTQAHQALAQVGQSIKEAARDIEQVTSYTLSNAIQKPVSDFERDIKTIRDELINTSNGVKRHVDASVKALKRIVWIAGSVFMLAGIVCAVATIYALMQTRQEVKKAEWISSVNAAVANGKLIACLDGGICTVVDKKLVRLDK